MAAETAGDPMTGLKWTRRTTARIAAELRSLGIEVCPRTVARLLGTMGFALRVNHKKRAGASHPDRDAQFQHIAGVRRRYPGASQLHILADSGGSNSCTSRAWKYHLQHRLCGPHRLTVTVAHYPTATSKWNPIEHRLFCEISKNWAGRPLTDYPTVFKYLRTTTTRTGLRVCADCVRRVYKKGVRISDNQMRKLNLTKVPDMPKWNYTLSPS